MSPFRLHRAMFLSFALFTARVPTASAQSAGAPLPNATAADARRAIASLADPSQATRDAAAAELRRILAANPNIAPPLATVRARLARFHPGMRVRDFETATHATSEGAGSGGGGTTATYRLDDFWVVTVISNDRDGTIRSIETPTPSVRHVWVQPPARFTGHWVVYFVNGVPSHEIDYQDGSYTRFRAFYDNRQLTYEQRYTRGQIDGDEAGFHRDGSRMYEIHHANGQNVGHWVHWYPSGRIQSEENYAAGQLDGPSTQYREDGSRSSVMHYHAGQETGQAAWDEHGTLLYAHGTAASEVRDH